MADNGRLAVLVLDERRRAQILLAGELDLDAAGLLEQSVATILESPRVRQIEVDVALVLFCDAGGLSALLGARHRAEQRQVPLYLVQVRAVLQKVLDASGLNGMFRRPAE
ncbi:STAS domain-containing protein [Streptacidiphilus sp. N1-12]|uniref:STAS domain-containing protein n=2 Tax=Streptacidiphilus alkalitolerans TaxID=3342712 RepID=A0ABV6VDC2_9ACTN